jgi:hypothetical protein
LFVCPIASLLEDWPAWASCRGRLPAGTKRFQAKWAPVRRPETRPANNQIGARTYGSVKSILSNNLDRQAAAKRPADAPAIAHPNIRGARYYH